MNIKATSVSNPDLKQVEAQTVKPPLEKKEVVTVVDYRSSQMCRAIMNQTCEEARAFRHKKTPALTEADVQEYKDHTAKIPQKVKDAVRDSYIGLR